MAWWVPRTKTWAQKSGVRVFLLGGTHGAVELKDIGCLSLDGLTEEVAEHSFLVWLRANHVPVEVGAVLLVACHHPTPGIPCGSGVVVVWRRNECHGSHE